ncbi:hypothetical protein E4U34_006317 [Claviceps purpurea]|nr:hypothetical protein E4U34_006317 [Claviceps purpurea]
MALILNPQNESIFLRQRIQDLERQIQERDRELQQERERALQKERERTVQPTEQRVRILELAEQRVRIFEQSKERQQKNQHTKRRNEKRQRRDQQRDQRAAKRERALQQERDQALEQAEKTARLAREKEVALQQERDRALQQAKEREITLQQAREREITLQLERDRALRRTEERDRALRLAQARDRGLEIKMEGALRIERVKAQCREEALQRERDRALQQAQEREKALQQERDRALQQAQDGQRQAEERARALKKHIARASQLQCERDRALQLVRKYDPALQYSTLNEYVKECHDSLFSKLTIDPNARRSGNVCTTKILGKWQPEKLLEWTDFLSEQRVMFDLVCDVIPPELREFPRLTTVRDDGTKIAPIADEKTLEKFVEESIENPVKHIMIGLQSADKLGRICKGELRVDFINHAEHTKPLKTETTSPQPGEPVSTRFCISRDPSVAMASNTLLYRSSRRLHSEK